MYDTLIQFFNQLFPFSPAARSEIKTNFNIINLPKNYLLAEKGRVCNRLYFILEGCCRHYHFKHYHEITHWFNFENSLVTSLYSFAYQKPSFESIQLLEDSRLLYVEHDRLHYLFDNYHEWERAGRMLLEDVTTRLEDKVMNYYSLTAKEKYAYLLEQDTSIIRRVPMKYISSYLGVAPESLSRIRSHIR